MATLSELKARTYELSAAVAEHIDPTTLFRVVRNMAREGKEITAASVSARIGASEDATAVALGTLKDAGQLREASGIKEAK
jgi:hypothetical protein